MEDLAVLCGLGTALTEPGSDLVESRDLRQEAENPTLQLPPENGTESQETLITLETATNASGREVDFNQDEKAIATEPGAWRTVPETSGLQCGYPHTIHSRRRSAPE